MTRAENHKGPSTSSETGQIPRNILETYREAIEAQRESREGEAPVEQDGSITGVFKMRKRTEGHDGAKDAETPAAGNAVEPAQQ